MVRRRPAALPLFVLIAPLAGCAGSTAAPVEQAPPAYARPSALVVPRGLDVVIGHGPADLERLFGPPATDTREESARRLQWRGPACVLDAYLYPRGRGNAEVATYVDARRSDGAAVDRAACVAALSRR